MNKISKKQRMALKEISKLESERKRHQIFAWGSIALMVVIIAVYNTFTYDIGTVTDFDFVIRAAIYTIAMVIAGFSGIMLMKSSQKKRKIDGFRQSASISRDTLDAWNRGEYDE